MLLGHLFELETNVRPILRGALAAVVLAGCGASPHLPIATPDKGSVASSPSRSTTGKPILAPQVTDAVILPVALTDTTLNHTQLAEENSASDAMPMAKPTKIEELPEAFRLLRDGFKNNQGEPFNLFDLGDAPAHAVIEPEPSLSPTPGIGFSVQAMPEKTQGKADNEAFKWAADARQIYVGWGFSGRWAPLSSFGQSRHVYYSITKKRLLYVDYSFLHFTRARWESDDIILKIGGKYLTWILTEPRGRYPYNGREAFNEAARWGYVYENRPRAIIKGIAIHPILIGPKWVFFDASDRPSMTVDAADGEVRWDGYLLDILRLLFMINP